MNNSHGGKRPGAGKPRMNAELAETRSIRLTQSQWQELYLLGGIDWLRGHLNNSIRKRES